MLLLLALAAACALAAWQYYSAPGAASPVRQAHVNRLGTVAGPYDVSLQDPVEFDGMTRMEIFEHRVEQVALNLDFVAGTYEPDLRVFGRIEDGLRWWGLDGQFCAGPGDHSHDGASEESRFLSNPLLLVGVKEGVAPQDTPEGCFAVWPRPTALRFEGARATVTYDLTRFAEEKQRAGLDPPGPLMLDDLNARDWGFQFLALVRASNLVPDADSPLLDGDLVQLRGFVHEGGSCGQQPGCNNGSPRQSDLRFLVAQLPASMTVRLYRSPVVIDPSRGDFDFTIRFE